jgi:hypothetical protein
MEASCKFKRKALRKNHRNIKHIHIHKEFTLHIFCPKNLTSFFLSTLDNPSWCAHTQLPLYLYHSIFIRINPHPQIPNNVSEALSTSVCNFRPPCFAGECHTTNLFIQNGRGWAQLAEPWSSMQKALGLIPSITPKEIKIKYDRSRFIKA